MCRVVLARQGHVSLRPTPPVRWPRCPGLSRTTPPGHRNPLGWTQASSLVAIVVALLLGGCTSGAAGTGVCSQAREVLDPMSSVHLLPGAPEPSYRTDPPTSGAHRLGSLPRGVVDTPLSRPTQVALLEKGSVVVQYHSGATTLDPGIQAIAGRDVLVTVAPNSTLAAPLVATAWTWKLTCRAADSAALAGFIRAHEGHGPSTP